MEIIEQQKHLFDPVEMERLSHPRNHGFFALLFPCAANNTLRDTSMIQGKFFPHLPESDVHAAVVELQLSDTSRPLVVAVEKKADDKRRPLTQRSFGLQHLEAVVGMCQGRDDHYLSQSDFNRPNRLSVNLFRTSSVWLDLDIYNSPLSHLAYDETLIVSSLRGHCRLHEIPWPSVIIRSGRGYYMKWFTEALPAAAFPRVRAVMVHLCEKFRVFGADKAATDASRVLRVGGSQHSKVGRPVQLLWKNEAVQEYVFDTLANAVLPIERTKEQAGRWREGRDVQKKIDARKREAEEFYKKLKYDPRKARVQSLAFQPNDRQQNLWWSRMLDFRKLVELRGEQLCQREIFMFLMMNALAWSGQCEAASFWRQAQEIAAMLPHQKTMDAPKDTLSTMYRRVVAALDGKTQEYQGQQVSALYRYKNSSLIEKLGITTHEMGYMLTLIDSDEIRRRKLKHQKEMARNKGEIPRDQYIAQQAERRGHALRMRQEGLSWAEIGQAIGITDRAARMLASRAK